MTKFVIELVSSNHWRIPTCCRLPKLYDSEQAAQQDIDTNPRFVLIKTSKLSIIEVQCPT